MAYDNRYRDRGRFDEDRERWRSEDRDQRGGRDYGRGSAWESGGYGRDRERDEDRIYGQDFGGDRDRSSESRGIFSRDDGSSRGYGVYGGSYGGGDMGRSDYGRGDQDRGYGREDRVRGGSRWGDHDRGDRDRDVYGGGGSWRGSDYGSRSYGGGRGMGRGDFGRGSAGAGYGYGEGRGHTGSYGPREDDRGFFERAGDEIASWFGDDDAERRRQRDARAGDDGAQHHRGRGPRGYNRSDDRIREDVSDRLTDDPYIDASDIDVRVEKGEVTLTGHVDNRNAKRRAEDVAEAVSGVTHVQNNLRVRERTGVGGSTTTGAAAMAGLGGSATGSTSSGTSGTGAAGTSGSGTAGTNTTGTIPMTSRSTTNTGI